MKTFLIGLFLGIAIGIIIGVIIDKDYYIKGRIKQKGRNNVQDITPKLNFLKRIRRRKNDTKKK